MKIQDIFYKEIDRNITGVIKIGQQDNLYQELEEYVVTKELNKHFGNFFESYEKAIGNYTDKMGVWISGFFGSGKSHFLKILSYLLENKEVEEKKAVKYFDDKIEDPFILARMNKVSNIENDIILFNIDSKADSDSKVDKDAIVKVFMKVFNEKLGYCGSIPWLADMERKLDKEGSLEKFKSKFKELSGNSWEDKREDFYFEEESIVEALVTTTSMTEESARNWHVKSEDNYTLSIEKFANLVREYVETKGKDYHLIFLVDEIGQYIGGDSNLSLNLQTVVEDLGTQCGGKVWVIVTSQQDIDSITKVKGRDFSKIQGRFNTRLNLSSANVDEVIKRRILSKKDETVKDTLKLIYNEKSAVLKNLITFSNSAEMKTYKNESDFVEIYPFIPYQFNLLQSVFTGIREHGASGKHLSEGERSLLSAFQEAAVQYMDSGLDVVIPFSAFYKSIESFLEHNISRVIIQAQNNDEIGEFDVEVLKVLFMIKYVKELPSNIENIATLLVSNIDEDKLDLKKKVEKALKNLLKETLIQKNGDEYIFLTNDEQDVNREIQNEDVELDEVLKKVCEVLFLEIYKQRKFNYGKYNFSFNQAMDEYSFVSKNEIGVKVLTPYYDRREEISEQQLKLMASTEKSLVIKLPPDSNFLDEMEEVMKIDSFWKKTGGRTNTPEIEDIRNKKSREREERIKRSREQLEDAITRADFYINTTKLDIKQKNPVIMINEALKSLIEVIYNKLNYIDTYYESSSDIDDILHSKNKQLTMIDNDEPNKNAILEIDNYIDRNTDRCVMTLKTIIEDFSIEPYGWREMDITACVAMLFRKQELRIEYGNEFLNIDDSNTVNYFVKRDYKERLKIRKRKRISNQLIQNVKKLSKEVFIKTSLPDDEDGLMNEFKKSCREELSEKQYSIKDLLSEYKVNIKYPGKKILEDGKKIFEDIIKIRETEEFFQEVYKSKDDILDYEEDMADIRDFFKNQKKHFDDGVKVVNIFEENRTYVDVPEIIELVEKLENIIKSKEPYSQIKDIPELVQKFNEKFAELLEKECEPIKIVIKRDFESVKDEINKYEFKDKFIKEFNSLFESLINRIEKVNSFYKAIALKEESDRTKKRCLDRIGDELAKIKPKPDSKPGSGDVKEEPVKFKKTKNVSIVNILHGTRNIESEEDIDEVVGVIKEKLKKELEKDTIVKLI